MAALACSLLISNGGNDSREADPFETDIDLDTTYHKAVLLDPGTIAVDLPSSYSQADEGIVTSVKDQSPWGTCWAFAGTAAAETAILKYLGTTAEESELDLSERHLVWFSSHPVTAEDSLSQQGEGIHVLGETADNANITFDVAGTSDMFSYLYSCGIGPVLEKDFPYRGVIGFSSLDFFTDEAYAEKSEAALGSVFKSLYGGDFDAVYAKLKKEGKIQSFIDTETKRGLEFPEGTTPDNLSRESCMKALRAYVVKVYTRSDEYSKYDDWSIPATDERGESNRFLTAGCSLLNGNVLPDTVVVADKKYAGINEYTIKMIKKEIYEGKGISVGYKHSSSIYNAKTGAIYNPEFAGMNHYVQIVGWDDDYSKDNFLVAPEKDGAWLIKNSWGSETDGHVINGKTYYDDVGFKNADGKATGFMWISYYDRTLTAIESLEFTDKLSGEEGFNTYMHDYLPGIEQRCFSSNTATKTANVFKIESDEKLTALSISTTWVRSDVSVAVYLLSSGYKSPEDGTKVYSFNKVIENAGYHTIFLDAPIGMKAGQSVSIVVEEKNTNFREGKTVYLASPSLCPDKTGAQTDDFPRYGESVVNEGESFLFNLGKWMDWSKVAPKMVDGLPMVIDNFSIKAFTVDA
ncbi:MAG: hypothetical protein IKP53_06610 [Candidatus Methanomethylophilaceae archaeon]|nr:hypothetical protein [Candidatus Methanomethylophilaceae archaeon]